MDFLYLTEENFTNNIKRIENNDNILSNEKEISKFWLNLNQDKLIKFCILLGCDYLSSIKDLGVKSCIGGVVGLVKYKIRYIGYPTVLLNGYR